MPSGEVTSITLRRNYRVYTYDASASSGGGVLEKLMVKK